MGLYNAAWRTNGAGSTTLPIASLYSGGASNRPRLREIGVFNTTSTAVSLAIQRLTTTGTQGAGQTEDPQDTDAAAVATAFDTHSGAPTLGNIVRVFTLAAAIGAGTIFTFGGDGLWIPPGTGNGVGIIVATGTGQICDVNLTWQDS